MKVFLIILAVLVVIFAAILSLSAEFTVIYDNKWTTRIRVLFIEKDIELSKLLSFILFPEKAAEDARYSPEEIRENATEEPVPEAPEEPKVTEVSFEGDDLDDEAIEAALKYIEENKTDEPEETKQELPKAEPKPNYIQKIYNDEGILGIMLLASNLLQTAGTAVNTLVKGLHIYSLYVKMIIGGGDAADIGEKYGDICAFYYPIKGVIVNQMKIDMYDDLVIPDFIAPRSEYEFQIIASINIALLLKMLLRSGKVFLVNLIKNK